MEKGFLHIPIPYVEKAGATCVQMTDFVNHRDAIVYDVVNEKDKVLITNRGCPYFFVELPPIMGHVEYEYGKVEHWRPYRWLTLELAKVKAGRLKWTCIKVSDFMKAKPAIVERLNDELAMVVTRYGWPEFVITAIDLNFKERWGDECVVFDRYIPEALKKERES